MKIPEKCECIACGTCKGTGTVWVSWEGDFMSAERFDDMGDTESCPDCGGDGLYYYCLKCSLEDEEEEDKEYEYWRTNKQGDEP
jgi:DnaJ-class molecular chaperone